MRLTDAERATIRQLSAEGKSTRAITEALPGISQSSVTRFLRKEDLVPETVTGRDGKTQTRRRASQSPRPTRRGKLRSNQCPVCGEPIPCGHDDGTETWTPGPTVACWVCRGGGVYQGSSGILWRCEACNGAGDVPADRREQGAVLFNSRWSPAPGYWASMVPADDGPGDDADGPEDWGAIRAREKYRQDYWRYVGLLKKLAARGNPDVVQWVEGKIEAAKEDLEWEMLDWRREYDPDYCDELVAYYGDTPRGRKYAARAEELRRQPGYLPAPSDSPDSPAGS